MIQASMGEVMTRCPATIEATATVAQAQVLMRELQIRHLPVMRGEELVGIVSDRDLYIMEALAGVHRELVDVSEAMTASVYTTTVDAGLRDVASVMAAKKYGAAVVMRGSHVVGIFTVTDALHYLVELP